MFNLKQTMIIKKLGLIPYENAWEFQKHLQKNLIEGSIEETLLVCEHSPVITMGSSAKTENILIPEDELLQKNIKVFKVERGGDVTGHAPGQIVLYPILNLNLHKKDVAWYMRTLEEIVIKTLALYGIEGERIAGKTGVWVKDKKIASIGVRISRWCTMHGLSLNIAECSEVFSFINPCGYKDIEITEMQKLVNNNLDKTEVTNNLIKCFVEVFKFEKVTEETFTKESSFEKEYR